MKRACIGGLVALLLGACARSDPSVNDPIYEGFDQSVVAETLTIPHLQAVLSQTEGDETLDYQQGFVFGIIDCRNAFVSYKAWLTTGTPGAFPTVKLPPSMRDIPKRDTEFRRKVVSSAISSGDPAQLKARLAGDGTCGEFVPVQPGDINGPTIEDAVLSMHS